MFRDLEPCMRCIIQLLATAAFGVRKDAMHRSAYLSKRNKMKKTLALLTLAVVAAAANALTIVDPASDIAIVDPNNSSLPFNHADLTSFSITNDLTNITLTYTTMTSIEATNWAKYTFIARKAGAVATGTSGTGNGWGRPFDLANGANIWVAGWADANPNERQVWTFGGGSWSQVNQQAVVTVSGNTYTMTVSLASLGLNVGDTINFNVATTGGGADSAWDYLGTASNAVTFYNTATTLSDSLTYTVVPEPMTMTALGLGLAALAARKRRKA